MGFLEWFKLLFNYCSRELANKEKRILELTNELNNFSEQIDYSFIPSSWEEIGDSVTTDKTQQDGIDLEWDVRDLLNSTIYSRNLADEVIGIIDHQDLGYDEYFNILCLGVANLVITKIKYKTNQDQFNVSDRWNNGDCAIVSGFGDCDLSARVFVRVMNDVLDKLKMFEYKKYIFQVIGFLGNNDQYYGHSWAEVYNPIDKKFKLI